MAGEVRLRWLGTAGFRLRIDEIGLLIDPYLTRNPSARPAFVASPDELFPAEALLLSHGHFDHAWDVASLVSAHPLTVYGDPHVLDNLVSKGMASGRGSPIASDGWAERIGPFEVSASPVRHIFYGAALVMRTLKRIGTGAPGHLHLLKDWPCGQPYAFRIRVGGLHLLHMGTAGATDPQLDRLMTADPIDYLLVALQGNARIYDIAAHIVERLRPRAVIPHHHDDFYPPISEQVPVAPFRELLASRVPETRLVELQHGEEVALR